MSKVAAITGALGKTSHKVTSRDMCSRVSISIGRSDDVAFPIDDVIVQMYIKHPTAGVRRQICPRIKLIALAEICTIYPENTVEVFGKIAQASDGATTVFSGKIKHGWLAKIDLTNDFKGLPMLEDDELVIEFEGVADHANRYLDVWTLEDDEVSENVRTYEELSTGNFKNQSFAVGDTEVVLVEKHASFKDMEFHYPATPSNPTGKVVKMDADELDTNLRTAYGTVTREQYAINGDYDNPLTREVSISDRYYIIVMGGAKKIVVNTTGATPLSVVLQK